MIFTVCISITFRDLKTETRFEDSALPFASAATAAKSLRHEAWNTWHTWHNRVRGSGKCQVDPTC